ncbi:MAG: murein transglycosylase A [Candidatus Marinarcus sp.]|uniref:murein transglycosylase A n=1 Tax=Candidatus Marinarcus sp. TaxID=3100987 RepID=UPI003B0028B0
MKKIYFYTSLMVSIFIMSGCSPKYTNIEHSKANLEEVSWDELDGFEKDNLNVAFEVFKQGCEKSKRKAILKRVCVKANTAQSPKDFFYDNFTPYKLYDDQDSDEGLITGYYEPLLYGSRTQSKKYPYPVYREPKDLISVNLNSLYPELKKYRLRGKIVNQKLVPYDPREKIKENENLEAICYVDDKINLYFLQIQGSGKIQLDTGEIINVGYANQNGHAYSSVGKYMIEHGLITKSEGSLQGMRKWFKNNPDKIDEVLNHNDSYIFFNETQHDAIGSLGVPLVAKRNLAVDRRYIPLGLPVFIQTTNPLTRENINQLMVAADTGGAIKGKIRADFFWGYGHKAEETAGRMKEIGKLFILLPN